MSELILSEKIGKVLQISLNRPDKYNSFTMPMAKALQEKLKEAALDGDLRCVLLMGEGKAFSAGQDLQEATDPDGPDMSKIVQESYNPIVTQIRQLQMPVVAAVNGVAAGAGANIALACDVCVAAESASFIQAFSKIGLIPDSGGTYTLPRLVGLQKASALMMLGDKISANDAEKMGMIYKVFADGDFENEAMNIAKTLSEMPTKGLAYTKALLNETFQNRFDEQLVAEDKYQTMAGNTEDYKEGVEAFLEKRKPNFKGK